MGFLSWVLSSTILLLVVNFIASDPFVTVFANSQKTIPTASPKSSPTHKPTKYPTTLAPSILRTTDSSASLIDAYYEDYENVFGSFYKPSSSPAVVF